MYASQFYDKIKERFPNKTTEKQPQMMINVNPQGLNLASSNNRFVLRCDNGQNLMVRFSDNLLIINAMKPYVLWNEFKDNILFAFKAYLEIAQPQQFLRISLRYINKINAGDKHSYSHLKRIFKLLPFIPDEIDADSDSTQMVIELPFQNKRDILNITQATLLPENEMKSPILFDMNYILLNPSAIKFEDFEKWLENAHQTIEDIFEKSLTEEIKQTF